MKKTFCIISSIFILSSACLISAQTAPITVRELPSINLKKHIPSGSYSGITRISGDLYAVVSDSETRDGFYLFNIRLDEESGELLSIENSGFYSSQSSGRDSECVAYNSKRGTIYVGGEKNNSIVEYDIRGNSTGSRSSNLFPYSRANLGMESLCYDPSTNMLWSISESTLSSDNEGNYSTATNGVSNMLRLTCFDTNFKKVREYAYLMDSPENMKKASRYAMGVSELCALPDGRLLVLEREAFIPTMRFGAWCNCKLYIVSPSTSQPITDERPLSPSSKFMFKSLLWSTKTYMSFNGFNWANYEGMCLGPVLKDGSQTILLISDSQDRYKGVLQDWLKILIIK